MIRNRNIVRSESKVLVPAELNFGENVLEKLYESRGKVCFINGATDEELTYDEILQQSMNVAISLKHIGVRKGQTIGLLSENRNEFYPAAIGSICAGAVLTTLNIGYTTGELTHVISISKPSFIFCSPNTYKAHIKTLKSSPSIKTIIVFGGEKFDNTISYNTLAFAKNVSDEKNFDVAFTKKVSGKDLFNRQTNELMRNIEYEEFQVPDVEGQTETAVILYSSGTTGLPKGVMLTHLNLLTACYQSPSHDPTVPTLTITPWYHVMGLVGTVMAIILGRTVVYLPKFEPNLYLKTIEKYKICQLTVVPPVLVALCKIESPYDVSSVRLIYSGAAPLRSDTAQALKNKFPNASVFQGYGMTEVSIAATRDLYNKPHLAKIGGVGHVLGSTYIKVADLETGEPLGPNKQGEICVKGPLVMKGYLGADPRENWRDKEGFLLSGDIGYYDEDGCFFIVDRLKELIKYKGFQVPPAEIEAVLLTHPRVKDAGVVAKDHQDAGEVPVAFVVKQPGSELTEQELKDFIAERLSNPKHLRGGVRFIDQIPKTASGKILRKELKQMVRSGRSKL